jgi:hypothetical protein
MLHHGELLRYSKQQHKKTGEVLHLIITNLLLYIILNINSEPKIIFLQFLVWSVRIKLHGVLDG